MLVTRKRQIIGKQFVCFLVEEVYYRHFCETALDSDLSPTEVARRYCVSGYTFSRIIWETIRKGGTVGQWVTSPDGGPNLAELALPDFSKHKPVRVG